MPTETLAIIIVSVLIGAFVLLFSGCASAPQIVSVPTKCSVDLPKEPGRSADKYETLRDLLAYLKQLKPILKECINDTAEY